MSIIETENVYAFDFDSPRVAIEQVTELFSRLTPTDKEMNEMLSDQLASLSLLHISYFKLAKSITLLPELDGTKKAMYISKCYRDCATIMNTTKQIYKDYKQNFDNLVEEEGDNLDD